MSNSISLLKANYCRSIMRTASIATTEEARRLIDGLTTEVPTLGISSDLAQAERLALEAIRDLADQICGLRNAGGMEWTKAGKAVENWIGLAGG